MRRAQGPAAEGVHKTWGGWTPREVPFDAELGSRWSPCGARSEVGRLSHVLIAVPSRRSIGRSDVDDHLMLMAPRPRIHRRQATGLGRLYESLGVRVTRVPTPPGLPNFVFLRDLFFMTPWGAVLGRPAPIARAGEERYAAAALAKLGVPIVALMTGSATFEGADAVWITHDVVAVGVGVRTNSQGFDLLRAILAAMGITAVMIPLAAPAQHLLGTFVPLSENVACIVEGRTPHAAAALAQESGYNLIEFGPSDEILNGRGLNFVCVAPRVVVLPDRAPNVARILRESAAICYSTPVGEYVKAAGGVACATGILHRRDD